MLYMHLQRTVERCAVDAEVLREFGGRPADLHCIFSSATYCPQRAIQYVPDIAACQSAASVPFPARHQRVFSKFSIGTRASKYPSPSTALESSPS